MDGIETKTARAVQPLPMRNHTLDSTRWHGFRFRDGDIVIASWAKTGTTWVQQIVAQLIFRESDHLVNLDCSPWVEQRCFSKKAMLDLLEGQRHRRFVKTHLPVESLTFSNAAKYVYIGRDGRDVIWSWYRHHRSLTPAVYAMINNTPGRVGPPLEPPRTVFREFFHEWLDRDGFPLWPFWSHIRSWWNIRDCPNVMLLHFQNLKDDLEGEIQRIARFLGVSVDEDRRAEIVNRCCFGFMKDNAERLSSVLNGSFLGGAKTFFRAGGSGDWSGELEERDLIKYEEAASMELSADCAHWLTTGSRETLENHSGGEPRM